MAADGAPPKRLRRNVAARNGDLPEARIPAENLARDAKADAAAAMFPDDEKLRRRDGRYAARC